MNSSEWSRLMMELLPLGWLLMLLGLLALLLELLNLRDRRALALRQAVMTPLALREMRGLVGIQIRSSVFSRRSVVILSLWSSATEQIWDAITRLSQNLPPRVRLVVDWALPGQHTARFELHTTGWPPPRPTREAGETAPVIVNEYAVSHTGGIATRRSWIDPQCSTIHRIPSDLIRDGLR
jgi:hypothetical protein